MNLNSSLNLVLQTVMTEEERERIDLTWREIQEKPQSQQFRHPVNWKGLGLLDYLDVIKKPMDMSTIRVRLVQYQYRFVQEALDDFQLIWDNCKLYNDQGSWIYQLADQLQKQFRNTIKTRFKHVFGAPRRTSDNCLPNTPRASTRRRTFRNYNDEDQEEELNKAKIVGKLKKLSPDDLGFIVEFIMDNSPQAIEEIDYGKFTIFMDKIDQDIIHNVKDKIQYFMNSEEKGTKRIKM